VFAAGMANGGIALYDISNPRAPALVGRAEHPNQREGHTTGFIETDEGVLAVSMASDGLMLWDLNNPTAPRVVKNVALPGIQPSDYDFGAWWVAVQSPYVYLAGSYNGLYIVDLSDVNQPRLVDRLQMDSGFRCGAVFAVGNLLVQSSSEGILTRLYDISDPEAPSLIREIEQAQSSYATMFNGGRLYAASDRGGLEIVDLSDLHDPVTLSTLQLSGGGAYVTVQEPFVHVDNYQLYYKIDASDPYNPVIVVTAVITTELPEVDVDFPSHMGNLVILSDDHNLTSYNAGSRIVPHSATPDTDPPRVNFISPADASTNLLETTRVGITLTDQILVSSVGPETFIVRTLEGLQVAGAYSVQQNIANFFPDSPLEFETTYEVIIPAGGIADLAGNLTDEAYNTTFSIGAKPRHPPQADAGDDLMAYLGEPVELDASGTRSGFGRLEYSWDPGDGNPPTPFAPEPTFTFTYNDEAHRLAVVTVRDKLGQTSSDPVRVTVVGRPLAEPPVSSSPLALNEADGRLWVVNPDIGTVAALDTILLSRIAELEVGERPTTVALAGDEVWVVSQDSGELSRIDAVGLQVVETVLLSPGSRPFGVVYDARADALYVTLEGTGELIAVDAASGLTRWISEVGPTPRGIAVVGESIFVSRFISPASHGEVVELERSSGTWKRTWTLAEDPGPDTDINGRGIPNYLTQIVPSPDGGRLYIPSIKQNTSRGQFRDGRALTFESTN